MKVIKKKDIKTLKDLKPKEEVKKIFPSKGAIYKKVHGHSKSARRTMLKNGIDPLSEYAVGYLKTERKKRKLEATKTRQKKHKESVAYRRANSKPKTKGQGKKKTTETKEKKK